MNILFTWAITLLLLSGGVLGTLIPAIPGVGLVFFGILFYAFATSFEDIGMTGLIGFAVVAALAAIAQTAGSWLGVKAGGGGKWAGWGTLLGALVGLTMGPTGLLLGAFTGALIGAFMEGHAHQKALKVALLSVLGVLGGSIVQIILAVVMIVAFFGMIAF